MSYVPQNYTPTSYVPTHLVQDGDAAFWGTLVDPTTREPSALFPRLTDAIFFYLDAFIAPQQTQHIEPSKIAYWTSVTTGQQLAGSQALELVDALDRAHFNGWKIPFKDVPGGPSHGHRQIAVLDRYGFMMYVLSVVRGEPEYANKALKAAISTFQLVDPMTRTLFPQIPRSALPIVADPEAAQLEQVIAIQQKAVSDNAIAAAEMSAAITRRGNEAALMAIGGYEYRTKYI